MRGTRTRLERIARKVPRRTDGMIELTEDDVLRVAQAIRVGREVSPDEPLSDEEQRLLALADEILAARGSDTR